MEPKEGFEPSTFRVRDGCSASTWTAPDGSSLLTSDGPSVQMAPDGSRRIQTDPDGSRRIQKDRLDDHRDDQGPSTGNRMPRRPAQGSTLDLPRRADCRDGGSVRLRCSETLGLGPRWRSRCCMRTPVPPVKERCDSDSSWAPPWPTRTTLAEPSRRPRKNMGAVMPAEPFPAQYRPAQAPVVRRLGEHRRPAAGRGRPRVGLPRVPTLVPNLGSPLCELIGMQPATRLRKPAPQPWTVWPGRGRPPAGGRPG